MFWLASGLNLTGEGVFTDQFKRTQLPVYKIPVKRNCKTCDNNYAFNLCLYTKYQDSEKKLDTL